ncbi:phosphatidylserine decarboxylase-related protein [Aspergillus terreus]|uniref:Phosphatidylserine decarboxylase-related protein n=1 Tax=Aspergillus terreus TaxID=33178 RepID=A0A5M3Z582_ASPTE|nr:hypothetical protein ATETN484_0009002300 [Aspergillus terreus]GFF17474.1 phosphatidylserine decarboxylase-related protein [Aspergillus terreus]
MAHAPIVQDLINQINRQNGWKKSFSTAVADCIAQAPSYMEKYGIRSLSDYFDHMDALLTWIPTETATATQLLERVRVFYFLFQQASVRGLQTKSSPDTTQTPLSWLSAWLVSYARSMGEFLNTQASLTPESLQTFFACPKYNLQDYIIPKQGWTSFNEFFARRIRPELRPIAEPAHPGVIVSPADSVFRGSWPIDDNSMVTFKGISWHISDLLRDSVYGEGFRGGTFLHSILFPWDYHRMHAPIGGTVLECRVIHAQVMLDVIAGDGRPRSSLDQVEGYQWCQTRGLVVMRTPIGKVAILPIGIGHISSVVMSVKVGQELRKGDELGYFQYGGSDIVLLFDEASNVTITAVDDEHHPLARYKMGERIGFAWFN